MLSAAGCGSYTNGDYKYDWFEALLILTRKSLVQLSIKLTKGPAEFDERN